MDAFELLKADHRKVAELFDRLESASGKSKLGLFRQIKTELELHTHIEETIFYPALESPQETHDLTLEAYEEHNVVKSLLAELDGAQSATDEWQAKAKVLRENVEHHVSEEENELFDKADDALSDEELEALGNRLEAEKAKKQGAPPPPKKAAAPAKKSNDGGIISKVASFIGLGQKTSAKKKAPAKKKAAAKKTSTKKTPTKKTAAKSSAKKKASGGSKKSAAKSSKSKSAAKKAGKKKASKR